MTEELYKSSVLDSYIRNDASFAYGFLASLEMTKGVCDSAAVVAELSEQTFQVQEVFHSNTLSCIVVSSPCREKLRDKYNIFSLSPMNLRLSEDSKIRKWFIVEVCNFAFSSFQEHGLHGAVEAYPKWSCYHYAYCSIFHFTNSQRFESEYIMSKC